MRKSKYIVIDGTHRLSILTALGIEDIRCRLVCEIKEYSGN